MYKASWARTSFVAVMLLASHLDLVRDHPHIVRLKKQTYSMPRLENRACACAMSDEVNPKKIEIDYKPHLWCSNILSSPTYASGFDSPHAVKSHIPRVFDQIL